MTISRALWIGLAYGLATAACAEDREPEVTPRDGSADSPAPRPEAGRDGGGGNDGGSGDSEAGVDASEDTAVPSDGAADSAADAEHDAGADATRDSGLDAGNDAEAGSAGPAIRLAFIADVTPTVDELWVVTVEGGAVGAPVRVSAPLQAGEDVTWMQWSRDGKKLVYRVGARELFLIDMAGATPSTPKRFGATSLQLAWSPDVRYIAYAEDTSAALTVVDLIDPGLPARSTPFCSDPNGCAGTTVNPPEYMQWSGDGNWLFIHDYDLSIWSARVDNGRAVDPKLLVAGGGNNLINAMWVSPVGAKAAYLLHYGGTGNYSYVGLLTAPASDVLLTETTRFATFQEWLPNGEYSFRGVPYGSTGENSYWLGATRVRDVDGFDFALKIAPNLAILAFSMSDTLPAPLALRLRRRSGTAGPWLASELAVPDFTTRYEWSPDSRYLVGAGSSLQVLDTGATPPLVPRQLPGSLPAQITGGTRLSWGHRSNRIFYGTGTPRTGDPDGVLYSDYRDAVVRAPSMITPSFAHTAGDPVIWELSGDDSYVASSADFGLNGVFELYVTSVVSSQPGTPQRVIAPVAGAHGVRSFGWQPD